MIWDPSLLCSDELVLTLRRSLSICNMKTFFPSCLFKIFFFFEGGGVFLFVASQLAENFSSFLPQLPSQESSKCTRCLQRAA